MSHPHTLDPRIHAYRADLADRALASIVKAPRYVESTLRQCVRGVVPLLAEPHLGSQQVSQIRYGECLDVFEIRDDGFAWVQSRLDHYVGYTASEGVLSEQIADFSNRIVVLKTFLYPKPDIKTLPLDELTLGSFVKPCAEMGDFLELANGGFVFSKHVMTGEQALTPDYVFTAGRMLGVPYLWGGRTPLGLDCSGLVQLCLELAGYDVPRDTDQQNEILGHRLDCHWRDFAWSRGDIVFFKKRHVGIMTGQEHIIHANGTSMLVEVEPLSEELVERCGGIIGVGKPSAT